MNDRELLELAAKAYLPADHYANEAFMRGFYAGWNPIDDDGQVLRLAVTLNIPILPGKHWSTAYMGWLDGTPFSEPVDVDGMVATRRAIVRAAAEIGRAME